MQVKIQFYSYCKELAGADSVVEDIEPGTNIAGLLEKLFARFPRLGAARKSLLVAVGVDYQNSEYCLAEGDEVSLFPPVQGG